MSTPRAVRRTSVLHQAALIRLVPLKSSLKCSGTCDSNADDVANLAYSSCMAVDVEHDHCELGKGIFKLSKLACMPM